MIKNVTTVSSPAQIGTVVRAPKTGELIATHLRRQIVRGELRPGETLPSESPLMEQYVWSTLTYRFHELILEGCGNKTMAVQGAVLQDIVATHLRTKIAQRDDNDTDERFQLVIRSYMKLIALVKAGNAAGAEKHWRSHMEGAAQYLLKDDLKTKPVVDLFA